MELIAEFAGPEMSFLSKTRKPRERMGRLAFIQFTTDPAAILLIVQRLEDVHRLVDPADLRPTPDVYCSAGHADPVVGRVRETETIYRCGPPRRCIDAIESWTSVLAKLLLFLQAKIGALTALMTPRPGVQFVGLESSRAHSLRCGCYPRHTPFASLLPISSPALSCLAASPGVLLQSWSMAPLVCSPLHRSS